MRAVRRKGKGIERTIERKEREYRITRCDLWYNIYKRQGNWLIRYLSTDKKWILKKDYARVYFHREEAISDLIIMRARDGKDSVQGSDTSCGYND